MSDSYSITIYVSLSEIQISVTDTGVTDYTVNNYGVVEYTNSVSASTTDFSIIDFIHPTCFSVGVLNVQYQPVILYENENISEDINDNVDLPSWSACCLAPMTTYNPSEMQSSFKFNYGYGNPLFYNGPYVQFLIIVGVSPSGCRFSSPVPEPDSLCTTIVSGSSCSIDYPIQVDISVQYDVPNFMTAFGIGLLGSPFSDSVVTYSLTLTNGQEGTVVDPNSPSNGCYWAMYPQIDDYNNGTNAWNDIIPLNSDGSGYSLDCSNIMTWENIVNESPTSCCGQYGNAEDGWIVYQFMPFSSSSSPLSYTQGGVNTSAVYPCCCSNQNTADGCLGTSVDGADVLCNANCSTDWLYCDDGYINCPGVLAQD